MKQKANIKAIGVLAFACIAASFSAILIKVCDDNPIIIANFRLLFASIILFPFWLSIVIKKKHKYFNFKLGDGQLVSAPQFKIPKFHKESVLGVLIPGILMGLHFMTWIIAVKLTTVANATLIINVQIIIVPILGFLFLKEYITTAEILGISLAFVGMLIVGLGDFKLEPQNFRGDVITFLSTIFFALYILFGRSFRRISGESSEQSHLIEYIFPVYTTAFLFITLFCLVAGIPLRIKSWDSFFWIVMLALIPTIIGHSLLNWSLRYVKPQIVSLFILSEFPISTIFAYILFTELPKHLFYVGAPLVVLGIIVALMRKNLREEKKY